VAAGLAPLEGRTAELEAVEAFLDRVELGPSSLVLEGEAGIGKTTLWGAGVAAARLRHYRILLCRPVEAETKMAFAALTDLVQPLLDDVLVHLPGPQKRAIEIALLRADGEGLPPDARAIGMGLLTVLRTAAAEGPLVLAIDDIQWLDGPSAGALEFALRRLTGEPVALLASLRIGDKRKLPLDLHLVAPAGSRRLLVRAVDQTVLDRILRRHLQADFRPPTVRRLHAASGGNPFFALEIGRELLERGEPPPGASLPIPGNLHSLIHGRLARLPRATREALTAAALLSHPTVELVGRGRADRLKPAVDGGVITIERSAIRFSHPLIASTLVADTPDEDRRHLHRDLANVVHDAEERARHLALSVAEPDEEVAAALEDAALAAAGRGAPSAAAELAEQACELTPVADVVHAQRRKMLAAQQLVFAGDYPRADRLLREAVGALTASPLRARGLLWLGLVEAMGMGRWDDSFITHEQAVAEAGDDLRLQFETERQLGWSMLANIRAGGAEPHLRRALELAERLQDRVALAESLAEVADLEFELGLGIREDLIDRALSLNTLHEHARMARHPLWALMNIFILSAQYERARTALNSLLAISRDRGEETAVPWILFKMAQVDVAAGNWPRAADLARQAHDLSVQTAQETMRSNALSLTAELAGYTGRVDEARAFFLKQPTRDRERWLIGRAVLGMLELSEGDPSTAWEHLKSMPEAVHQLGLEEPTVIPFWADAIEALIGLGRLDEARPFLDWLEERGRALERPWARATGGRCRALFLAAQGDFAAAVAAADAALTAHEELPMPYELARTLLAKGMIERRAKKKLPARESLQAALRIFEALGAARWADRTRGELQRIGGRSRSKGLTETEQRVADLVAAGHSNREIARAMFLSVKTVEANLSRIYAAVGVSSRTELAHALLTEPARERAAEAAADQTEGFPGFARNLRVIRSR
jgi:DNA-binding CsgD family transcriptional regulator